MAIRGPEDFEVCPQCGHDWIAHYQMIDPKTEQLIEPKPNICMECPNPTPCIAATLEFCCVCGKPAEAGTMPNVELCDCACPSCGAECFDDGTIADHGMCFDCHKKWQYGELQPIEKGE